MKHQIDMKFITYVKFMLSQSGISTRELSKRLNKAPTYISQLLSNKIKTIEYDTAFTILENIVPTTEDPISLLIEKFNILPDYLWEEREQQARFEEDKYEKNIKTAEQVKEMIGNTIMKYIIEGGDIGKILETQDVVMKLYSNGSDELSISMANKLLNSHNRSIPFQILTNALFMIDGFGTNITFPKELEPVLIKAEKYTMEVYNDYTNTKKD